MVPEVCSGVASSASILFLERACGCWAEWEVQFSDQRVPAVSRVIRCCFDPRSLNDARQTCRPDLQQGLCRCVVHTCVLEAVSWSQLRHVTPTLPTLPALCECQRRSSRQLTIVFFPRAKSLRMYSDVFVLSPRARSTGGGASDLSLDIQHLEKRFLKVWSLGPEGSVQATADSH